MSIIEVIVVAILFLLVYWLYKNYNRCGWNPVCYNEKTIELFQTCGLDPTCYYKKFKELN